MVRINLCQRETPKNYTRHSLERAAQPSPSVLAHLIMRARVKNYLINSSLFAKFVDPRGISFKSIKKVIKYGIRKKEVKGKIVHKGSRLTVVTDHTSQKVITVFPHSKTSKLSLKLKETLRQETCLMGNKAGFSQNVKKMVTRVKNQEVKEKEQHRRALRDKKCKL